MTAARADNAARDLLARLVDEADLETAPPDEVRADLALLGVDPARAIRFTRRLAEEASSPAAGLLAKSFAAEDDDREVEALETADLRAVQSELSVASPLAVAHAQRLANAAILNPRRRSPRRLWYGIGGAITAIAASVLIVIGLSSSDVGPRQFAFAPDDGSSPAMRNMEEQAAAPGTREPAESPATATSASSAPVSNDAVRSVDANSGEMVDIQARSKNLAPGSGVTVNLGGGAQFEFDPQDLLEGGEGDLPVKAVLILQPEFAPERLRQSDLGAGDLTARLPEAARFAGQKSVVALVTLEQADGTTIDAMLLRFRVQYLRKTESAIPNQDAESLALVEPIDAPQTLRRLLGGDIGEFRLIEMKPPAAAKQK